MLKVPEILETQYLKIRKFQEKDAEAVFSYAGNEETVKYMSWPRHISVDDSLDFVQYAIKAFESGIEYAFGIELKAEGRFIGSTGFQLYGDDTALLGIILHPDFQNKGYGFEALKKLYDWLKEEKSIRNVVISCHDNNTGAKRLISKLGIPLDYEKEDSALFPNLTGDTQKSCFYKIQLR